MLLRVAIILAISIIYSACSHKKDMAKAVIQPASGSNLTGEALFEDASGGVKLTLTVSKATPGSHAVHLHETGDCTASDATSAGGHWNPNNQPHGKRVDGGAFHRGDIANLEVGEDGTGHLEITAMDWSIGGDPSTDVLGKAVIIHAGADDFTSQPAGNAGARIGCGVIEPLE